MCLDINAICTLLIDIFVMLLFSSPLSTYHKLYNTFQSHSPSDKYTRPNHTQFYTDRLHQLMQTAHCEIKVKNTPYYFKVCLLG